MILPLLDHWRSLNVCSVQLCVPFILSTPVKGADVSLCFWVAWTYQDTALHCKRAIPVAFQ